MARGLLGCLERFLGTPPVSLEAPKTWNHLFKLDSFDSQNERLLTQSHFLFSHENGSERIFLFHQKKKENTKKKSRAQQQKNNNNNNNNKKKKKTPLKPVGFQPSQPSGRFFNGSAADPTCSSDFQLCKGPIQSGRGTFGPLQGVCHQAAC